ncbi:hypothetical protein Pmani_035011 [Petrolisthes manimaculis]|uniref:Uncharacterized protein n=1 Tax=Petrolisthes manimaculis TaxID=1843537 RepID=A0AAE1NNU3_9EUCA|nr:hypothetical protein Pmani_035011 [Petrolisthes manimaculis]
MTYGVEGAGQLPHPPPRHSLFTPSLTCVYLAFISHPTSPQLVRPHPPFASHPTYQRAHPSPSESHILLFLPLHPTLPTYTSHLT